MGSTYTLDQLLLQTAVHARQQLDKAEPKGGLEANYNYLKVAGEYLAACNLPSASFVKRMLETYHESKVRAWTTQKNDK